MKNFKISIPKPCHEDWNTMSPNQKGRFCGSCSKTVVDFTKHSAKEVQDYFIENQGKRICGHFRRKQLDSIVIQIPGIAFTQQLSFQRLFILALILAMGTTLFSCKTDDGKPQKIEKVELIDTIIKAEKVIDTIKQSTKQVKSIPPILCPPPPVELPELRGDIIAVEGEAIIEEHTTTGLPIAEPLKTICKTDSIQKGIEITGDIVEVFEEGEIAFEEIQPYLFNIVAIPPRFKGTKSKNREELQTDFNKKMNDFVSENFDKNLVTNLGLHEGKHKVYTQFTIDPSGNISDIHTRAPHIKLKNHISEIIQKLPVFISGKQNGKNVSVRYTLPISFEVE